MATRLTASEVSRNFSEVIGRVRFQGETFVVTRKGQAVAVIKPPSEVSFVRLADLATILHEAPHLSAPEAKRFEEDLEAGRHVLGPPEGPAWD